MIKESTICKIEKNFGRYSINKFLMLEIDDVSNYVESFKNDNIKISVSITSKGYNYLILKDYRVFYNNILSIFYIGDDYYICDIYDTSGRNSVTYRCDGLDGLYYLLNSFMCQNFIWE